MVQMDLQIGMPGMSEGARAAGPPSYRHDEGVGESQTELNLSLGRGRGRHLPDWAHIERGWWLILAATMLVFSAFPIANLVLGYRHQGLRSLVSGRPGRAPRAGCLSSA